ncbi:MAG TPA: class A beta-lactamase-related serine hydrolase [Candidatus Saccharicenans sp.]|jgi:beta-lactamase class A|nr:class A beta-lactamase-related serine hydrolase [Candidatus Saccharicenans sp.]HQM74988.1 class A beta-lactamase-related serine hydrolase [Candidatus Saccharicenans sp.]
MASFFKSPKVTYLLMALLMIGISSGQLGADNKTNLLEKRLINDIKVINDKLDGLLGLAIKDLATGRTIVINENEIFPQASSIKIAVLLEVLKQAEEGQLKLDEFINLTPEAKVGGGLILAYLGYPSLKMSIRDLAVLMVVLSDNTATNLLIDRVGMKNVNSRLKSLGLNQTRLERKMMDVKAAEEGRENISTPYEMMTLLEKIYKGQLLSLSYRQEFFNILALPKDSPLQQAVPEGVIVADKPGELEAVRCDSGLVFLKKHPYIICVMTTYLKSEAEGNATIKQIGQAAFSYFDRLERSSEYGRIVSEK